MSDSENPYNSPESQIVPEKSQSAGNLTDTMLGYLKGAAPWLRFIGILGFIGCGFVALGAIIALFGTSVLSSFMEELNNFPMWILSPIYFGSGLLIFFPSLFTYRFGDKIRKYQLSNSDEDLEQAFKNNKSYWKFCGILCIVYLALVPFMIIAGIAASVALAAAGFFG